MAKIYGTPIMAGGAGGANKDLPPLLDNFRAKAKGNISKKGHGEAVNIIDSIESELNGLKLYGKSTQDGTPTPDSPIPIVSAGESGKINIKIHGPNLISSDVENWQNNGWHGYVLPIANGIKAVAVDGWLIVSYSISSLHGKTMTVSFDYQQIADETTTSQDVERAFCVTTQNDPMLPSIVIADYVFSTQNPNTEKTHISVSFVARNYVTFFLQVQKEGIEFGEKRTIEITNIMLNTGDVELPFAPYKGQALPVSTPNGLPGIPVTSGGNYTDADGQQWICDEVDFGAGTHTQRIGKINSYNSETVGNIWMSTTGQLTPGATVLYKLDNPIVSNLDAEMIADYEALTTYAPVTNIMTDSTPAAGIEIEYASTAMNVELSANKMEASRANELAGAVWVYGDHEPTSVNDGTKIQLSRDEVLETSLSALPSGSKVKLGIYNGEQLKWIVARDSVTQDLRLVLDKDSVTVIGTMQYDAREPNNPDPGRETYGNNKYSVSNINQWLNSDGAAFEWYTAQHEYDAPPDYQNKAGFLNAWSKSDKSVLQEENWTTTLSSDDGSGMDTFSQKVVLMSTTELGLKEDTGGNRLDIFNSDGDRATGSVYWTRTPTPSNSKNADRVAGAGGLDASNGVYRAYGVRPICAPNPSAPVSGPDDEGYYTIGGEAIVKKMVQWNNEANFFARQFTYNSKKQYQTMLEGAIATLVLTGVPDPVTELAETHSSSSITLTWKNPTSDELYNHTVVVYKTDAFPTTIDDGTQGYSGTDETATLSDLEPGTTYYIAVFTVSAYGLYGVPQTVQVEIPAGKLLSSLASGTKVKLGKWNNTDLQWKVARDTSDQSIRLVLEPTSVSLLGNMQYDAPEPSNSNSNRKRYGNNRYIYSNIHQWLNATKASNWYTAQHIADAAPTYASSPGFLSGWSENHIAALDRATLTTTRASIDGGGTETFVARVSLISTTELGLQNSTGGGRLDIFNSDGDRAIGSFYWTRTPRPSETCFAERVTGPGDLGTSGRVDVAIGVRPLCIPVSTALVSLEMDDDNCYVVQ